MPSRLHQNGSPGGISNIARLTMRRELTASIPLAAIVAVLNNSFCGFIGRKALCMPDSALAALMASNMLGFLLVGPLVGFFNQTRKVTALARILFLLSAVLLTVSLTPDTDLTHQLGAYIFLAQITVAQIGLSLVTTLRSSIWRANYPLQRRGKITVIISLCLALGSAGTIFIYTALMDHLNVSFQAIYFITGLAGLLAAQLYARIRIRHERQTLRDLTKSEARPVRFWAAMMVLRENSRFRQFMAWQMLNGFSTLIIEDIGIVIIVSDIFADSGWILGGLLLAAVPLLLSGITGIFWARVFDRSNILSMRAFGAMAWSVSRIALMIGVWQMSLPIILTSRVLAGIAMGIGRLNWRLGHMEFAPPEKDSLYMGIHVSLTGLRGMIAPFLGIYLYRLECMGPHGLWLIGLTALGQALAGLGFYHMRKHQTSNIK